MSYKNYKYSLDEDPHEWCTRHSKRIKAIDPQMITRMRNHKLLIKIPRELDNAITCICNKSCTMNDIANSLKALRNRKNIRKHSQYRRSSFKEKQPFRVYIKDKPKEILAEVTKKNNSCHNFESTDHYANNCPKEKKKVPEDESPKDDSASDSMGDVIREQ
ncbi:hypothetical protein O181_027649 [Austropuccinia psidii MF-1]|uniref:Uncharacterized protein n=1 Tax=Austropuccinia psidii MF-1 TaxID=1389203 RepID=A0A9Q3CME6_9BASI|nr:hypothetical protein [Austropuccinia psidii MF-1]